MVDFQKNIHTISNIQTYRDVFVFLETTTEARRANHQVNL